MIPAEAVPVLRLPVNRRGRDFVIGDLHGETELLEELLKAIRFDESRDRLFSVGDLIDRGPDSEGAVALLDKPWFFAVRGNHEQMMINAPDSPSAWGMWMGNGGHWALMMAPEDIARIIDTLDHLPLAIVVGDGEARFTVVHAEWMGSDADLDGLNPAEAGRVAAKMLWSRLLFTAMQSRQPCKPRDGRGPIYVGHNVTPTVKQYAGHVFLDTGSCFAGGRLTCIEHATGKTWSVCHPHQQNGD